MKNLLQTTFMGIENLGIQVVIAIVLVALWRFIIKKYPMKKDMKSLVLVAMFVTIATVASVFVSIKVPLFGVDSLRIGFAQIILAIGGACISPAYAFIMGLVYDIVGLVLSPTTPFLGFTMNSILACLIPSVWYQRKDKSNMTPVVDGMIGGLVFLVLLYLCFAKEIKIDGLIIEPSLRIMMGFFIAIVGIIIIVSMHFILRRWGEETATQVSNWMFIVLMIEILIQFLSTPFWLQFMWGVPWQASLFLRVMKASVMVPLNTIIGVVTLKALGIIKS